MSEIGQFVLKCYDTEHYASALNVRRDAETMA